MTWSRENGHPVKLQSVGAIAGAKEESWHYATPEFDEAIDTITVSPDGAMVLIKEDGWREAMVGSLSLYDSEGERRHSILSTFKGLSKGG